MKIANDRDLYSVANLAVQYQQPFGVMREALDLIDAEPQLALNGVQYFSLDNGLEMLLREYFKTRRCNDRINSGAEWTAEIIPMAESPADSGVDGGSAGVDASE